MPSMENVNYRPADIVSTNELEDMLSRTGMTDDRPCSVEEIIADLQTLVKATNGISASSNNSSQTHPLLSRVSSLSHRLSTLLKSLPSSTSIPTPLLNDLFTISQTCYMLSYQLSAPAPQTFKSSPSASSTLTPVEPLPTVLSSKATFRERNTQASDARRPYILLLRCVTSQAESSPSREELFRIMSTSLENLFAQLAQDKSFRRVRGREDIRRKKDKAMKTGTGPTLEDLVALYFKTVYESSSGHTGNKVSERVMDSLREMEIFSLQSFNDDRFTKGYKWDDGQATTEYYSAYVKGVIADLICGSKTSLQQTLARLDTRDDKDWEGLSLAWEAAIDRLKQVEKEKGKKVETSWSGEKEDQVGILNKFLQLFLQGLSTFASSSSPSSRTRTSQLSASLDSLFSVLPSPAPRVIYQTLISHYARSDAVELGGPTSSLQALRAVWMRMRKEGVPRDVKTYMMCMEGLGRKGDGTGLKEVWEELRIDKDCRDEWEREEREKSGCECLVAWEVK